MRINVNGYSLNEVLLYYLMGRKCKKILKGILLGDIGELWVVMVILFFVRIFLL